MIEDPFLNLWPARPDDTPFADVWTKSGDIYYALMADTFWRRDERGEWVQVKETTKVAA